MPSSPRRLPGQQHDGLTLITRDVFKAEHLGTIDTMLLNYHGTGLGQSQPSPAAALAAFMACDAGAGVSHPLAEDIATGLWFAVPMN